MGIGNFFKKKKKGIESLPTTSFESVIFDNFQKGVPFLVTIPINVTVQTSGGSLTYLRVGMFGRGFYSPPEYKTTFQKIYTNVRCDFTKIIIEHALKNGQHIFVYLDDIAGAKMYNDGVAIELINGTRYVFALDDYIIKQWKSSEFSTDYLRVFYKLLTKQFLIEKIASKIKQEENSKNFQDVMENLQNNINSYNEKENKALFEQKSKEREQIKEERILKQGLKTCPNCGENIPSNAVRCKYCKTMLKEYENNPEYRKKQQELLKNPKVDVTEIKETPSKNIEETIEVNEDSVEKIEEGVKVNEDPFEKIKKAKELLDIGAITPEEFDKIKSKYFKQITESGNSNDESDNENDGTVNGNDESENGNEESDNGEPLYMPGIDHEGVKSLFKKIYFEKDDV